MSVKKAKARPKQRFAVGAEVRVKLPGLTGIVTQMDSSPTVLGEYWHTIHTQLGDRKEPGSILELIPTPMTNAKPQELSIPITDEGLLSPDKAISLLRDRLDEAVEHLHHNDPEVDSWERVLQKIVERAFGEHSRNAKHFVVTLSKARQSDDERQAWHVDHIREKRNAPWLHQGT